MILVDTSVWVDHLRVDLAVLSALLGRGQALVHPFVLGELALGNLRNRREILGLLARLPAAPVATDDEILGFIERHGLVGRGIGYVDVHLLASARSSAGEQLWTRDKRLAAAATRLGVGFDEA